MPSGSLAEEISRRRTFAIISHPDAGKTTLTEKLLLFGGAIQMAGTVKGRKATRHATSDWMRLEQQRGISVTSSVMQFPFEDCIVNLLDTPGHEDFSEDTYRTLTAVDSALMVIDCAKGVEERTIKLMEVCRLRDTPIMTFINKLDRDGRSAVDLLDEIEQVLGIGTAPVTWPVGMGRELRGIYHLLEDRIYVYAAGERGRVGENRTIDGLRSAAPPRASTATPTAPGGRRRCSSARPSTISASRSCSPPLPRTRRDPCRARRASARCSRRRRRSPASSSRSRPTWIRRTATASRSCGCAPASTRAACASTTCDSARRCAWPMRSPSWPPSVRRRKRRSPATSSACTTTAPSTSATPSRRASA